MGKFKKGVQYVNVVNTVTKNELISLHDVSTELNKLSKAKFIPASGAATCMFKDLYIYLEEQVDTDFIDYFFEHLESFAFYEELRRHINFEQIDKNVVDDRVYIIETLLNDEMNYGSRPKALIPFHRYDDRLTTPIDEHIFEGEHFLDADNLNLHFMIAEEAEDLFNAYIETATEGKNDINITYSFQKKKTNTVTADMDNNPLCWKMVRFYIVLVGMAL